jgi:chemotaxis family two-component system sensor histidine kinase/response regulator PixL
MLRVLGINMAIDSDIRDQAYQFFIQEAPELLQVIEAELLTLRQERSTAKIHNVMRAAHSIKGGLPALG